jgi:hypothetical protein
MCVSLVPTLTDRPVKSGFPFLCDGLLLSKKKSKLQEEAMVVFQFGCQPIVWQWQVILGLMAMCVVLLCGSWNG